MREHFESMKQEFYEYKEMLELVKEAKDYYDAIKFPKTYRGYYIKFRGNKLSGAKAEDRLFNYFGLDHEEHQQLFKSILIYLHDQNKPGFGENWLNEHKWCGGVESSYRMVVRFMTDL